jgi:hypothetical protein
MRGAVIPGLAAGLLLGLSLGACEAPGEKTPATAAAQGSPPAASAQQAAQPAPAPQQAKKPDAPVAALPRVPVIDDNPERLMGLSPNGVAKLLGTPALVRREPPAEIWQYRGASCVFDVFLYENAGAQRVTYLEARDQKARRIVLKGCFGELLRARLAKPLG